LKFDESDRVPAMPEDRHRSWNSIETAHYVEAVHQRHGGDTDRALHARLALAGEYFQAKLYDDAIDLLASSVIDGHRIWGPDDARTLAVRLDLGDALLEAGRPLEALAGYSDAQLDLVRVVGIEHALSRRCEAGVVASTAAYEALL
jgi:hypothetical protein